MSLASGWGTLEGVRAGDEPRPKAAHPLVRELIDAQGRRYTWVAFKLGLTPDRFAHIIDGRRPPPEPTEVFYLRLGKLLGADSSELRPEGIPRETEATAA